jgi:hypothetical protein
VTIRVYVDGEASPPAIQFRLYESHALGFGWSQGEQRTWGTKKLGKGALFGGLYLTFQVPFSIGFRVTAELDAADKALPAKHGFYMITRGLENAPVVVSSGSIQLPAGTRLRIHRTAGLFNKSDLVSLVNIGQQQSPLLSASSSAPRGGLVYFVTFIAASANPRFLEGEFFALIDNATTPMRLSSGTEDYFLSAQYFDAGMFEFPNSGCNHLSLACLDGIGECRVAAYRSHDADPIVFQKSLSMYWEVGDSHWTVDPVNVAFTTWVYEWPAA